MLAVPVLVSVVDQTVLEATTSSLVVVAAAVAGGLWQAHAGRVCGRHAASFTAAARPGIALGTLAAEPVSGALLLAGSALVTLAAAHATWRKANDHEVGPAGTWEGGGACPPLRRPQATPPGPWQDGPVIEIVTQRLSLRPFRPVDLPGFVAYRSDPEVARYQSWDTTYSVADGERFLASQ